MLTPGKSRSTKNAENFSPSIFANTIKRSAHLAFEIHIFVPLSTHLSPCFSARVCAARASVPLLGSLKQYADNHSPLKTLGKYLSFCAGVPNQEIPTCPMPLV